MKLKIEGLKVDAGGEGSRGGLILGHTNSGKPVYKNFKHPSHVKFSHEEHSQAENIHDRYHAAVKKQGKKAVHASLREQKI